MHANTVKLNNSIRMNKNMTQDKIGIIGLGYVGLPLAVEFARYYPTIGYDINPDRIDALQQGKDSNREVATSDLRQSQLSFSAQADALSDCTVYIVTLPTPVRADHKPDLSYLLAASKLVGDLLKPGDLVIFESTVYPGATEDDCIPVIEQESGLTVNQDFGVGYSPERINPGDKNRPLSKIIKVTSGSSVEWARRTDALYKRIVTAGTYPVSSIKVAEACKVIENTQRDMNIAFMNQLAQLFSVLNIDTQEVLEAASSKWNFLPFKPGLVGGHCIGVDPYYLCHKAESVGYIPDIILASRRLNDAMPAFVATEVVKLLSAQLLACHSAKVLILGVTFKEDCPDIRNSKVAEVHNELSKFHCQPEVYDPIADTQEVLRHLDITLTTTPKAQSYDLIVLAVAHKAFIENWLDYAKLLKPGGQVYDLKAVLPKDAVTKRL